MKQIVALLIVTGFLAGCGAQVSLTASVPEGKDLDVTIKTSETPETNNSTARPLC